MENTKLLIIDDDPDYVDGIKSILEKAKYQVDAAYNPKDGIEALKSGSYDLLLLDIMMGRGAEGVMVARKINKDPKLREIPRLKVQEPGKRIHHPCKDKQADSIHSSKSSRIQDIRPIYIDRRQQ